VTTMKFTDAAEGEGAEVLRSRRFWMIVIVVIAVALVWQIVVITATQSSAPSAIDFVPLGLFLVPVLFASINFGMTGGIVVSGVVVLVTIPWFVRAIRADDPVDAWFDVVQVLVLVVVAYFVGRGVTGERKARMAAEASRQAHSLAEARYRDLFETNSEPILLFGEDGVVQEANAAADRLFGSDRVQPGRTLADLVGPKLAGELVAADGAMLPVNLRATVAPGTPVGENDSAGIYQPVVNQMVTIDEEPVRQLVLRDLTEEARRRERLEAYALSVVHGQEDERRRIAQELHDGPLQVLIHLCRQIDALAALQLTDAPAQHEVVRIGAGAALVEWDSGARASTVRPPNLTEVRTLVESVVDEIRGISRGLRPPLLDDLGLEAALQRLCDEAERSMDVTMSLTVSEEVPARLLPEIELVVYRIAQEALSNAARHSGAQKVEVSLGTDGPMLQLRVTDDGEGFEVPAEGGEPALSLGLSGMAERADLVGGAMHLRSRPGGGTVITVDIPHGGPNNAIGARENT